MASDLLELEPKARNVISEAADSGLRVMPLSLEQYHRMIDQGILPEDTRIELLDGMLIPKDRGDVGDNPRVVGETHTLVVKRLSDLTMRLDRDYVHIQTQQPVIIAAAGSEPEPDAAIVQRPAGTIGKPQASEVACVIEVAGSSLQRDRTTKRRHYALGGIQQYIIINLAERNAEEYLHPDQEAGTYAPPVIHAGNVRIHLTLFPDDSLAISLSDLLPSFE